MNEETLSILYIIFSAACAVGWLIFLTTMLIVRPRFFVNDISNEVESLDIFLNYTGGTIVFFCMGPITILFLIIFVVIPKIIDVIRKPKRYIKIRNGASWKIQTNPKENK